MALIFVPVQESRTSSVASAERLKVAGSISASSGCAPQRRIALTLAKKLNGVVMTASPGPTFAAANASQMASVPLAHPMACGAAHAIAAAFSKLATCGPRMNFCERQTASMVSISSCRSEANWREKSSIGTGCELLVVTFVMLYRLYRRCRQSLGGEVRLTVDGN